MADYTQPDVVNKRVRFFDGQFLQDQDFIDEQRYHLDRERRQSRLLSVTGIVSGLTVTKSGSYQVTVAKGVAIDALGRQLILAADLTLRLTDKFAKKQDIELRLVYQETPTDVAQTGGKSARRWDESPKIAALAPDGTVAVAPDGASPTWDGPTVLLARLAAADNGDVTIDTTAARQAGLSVPGAVGIGTTKPAATLEISGGSRDNVDLLVNGRLRSNNNDGGLWIAEDRFVGGHSTNQIGFFNGGEWRLTVQHNGNVGIGTTKPAAKLEISGGGRDNVDLLVNGRLRSNNNDGGLWIAEDRFVGGHSTNHIGFFNGGTWHLTVLPTGHVGIGTTAPENADGWNKVVDILGSGSAKLSVRTARVDARVLAHDGGFFGSPVGMIVGTKSNHALSFGTNAASRLTISATGNVGIGTTNPSSDLEIGNFDARNRYLTLKVRGGNEYRSGIKLWTWQENYGYSLEYDERKGTGNGLHIRTHSKNADGTTRLFVGWDNGNVGIGTADPDGHRLCVRGGSTYLEGDIFVQGRLAYWWGGDNNWKHVQNRWDNYAGSYDTGGPSDGRLKTAVRPIRNALDKISRLEGIGYRWNEAGVEYLTRDIATSFSAGPGATAEENRRLWDEQRRKAVGTLSGEYLGLIAQDVDAVVPEVVHEDADGYKHIRYAHLTALLIEAVKEQQAAIEHLRARLVTVEPATA